MQNFHKILIKSIISTIILFLLLVILFYSPIGATSSSFTRILVLLGAELPGGLIQILTYFLFFYGIFSIEALNKEMKGEFHAHSKVSNILKEYNVINSGDLRQIQMSIEKLNQNDAIVDLLTKVNAKVKATESVSEALSVLSNQVRINKDNEESKQSLIRYMAWAIPSVGFIGTVIGIAASLGYADQVANPEGLKKVTDALYIAFDTTLIALVLNLFLMLFYHIYQEKVDKLHNNMESNILHNFINKIIF